METPHLLEDILHITNVVSVNAMFGTHYSWNYAPTQGADSGVQRSDVVMIDLGPLTLRRVVVRGTQNRDYEFNVVAKTTN